MIVTVTPVYGGPRNNEARIAQLSAARTRVAALVGAESLPLQLFTNTDLVRARSRAVTLAYERGFDHLLFWDDDVHGPDELVATCIREMVASGHDLVGVEYPKRGGGSVIRGAEPVIPSATFVSCRYLPMGFTLISRACMKTMLDAPMTKHLWFKDRFDGAERLVCALFALIINDEGLLLSEDYSFCERYAWCGGTQPHVYVGAGKLLHG